MKRWAKPIRRAVALGAAAFAVWSVPGLAQGWSADPDDALLLELHTGSYKVGDTLRGYQTPNGVCVDFADLIQTLDLPVRLDKKSRRATGWLFAEDQRITIDRDSNTVQTVNNHTQIPAGAIHDTPEGWCMDLDALSSWMGVRLKPDLRNLAIRLETDRKLPFLEAIERKSRAARLRKPEDSQFNLAALPKADAPYQSWRTPSVDVQIQGRWRSRGGANLQYEGLATGEVLGMSYSARLAGADSLAPDSLRLRLYRNDPDGGLLGPLQATRVAVGDVDTPQTALSAQSAYGRGAFVTNRPLGLPARFGVTTLRGELPAGWDAELYRNGELRAYQADRGDGRFEFADIELVFGENDFDVVLYGPQGQIRHQRSAFPVGIESLPAGKTWYWAGVLQQGYDLIGTSLRGIDPQTGWRWGVGVERGIDRRTTLGASYTSLVLFGRRRHYLESVLRRSIGPALIELSGAQQLGAGRALRGEVIGRTGGIHFGGHALWVDGAFDSDQVSLSQRREFDVRLGGTLKLGAWRLPVEFGARQTLGRNGVKVTELLTHGSFRISRANLTVELLHRAVSGDPVLTALEDHGNLIQLVGNTRIGRVQLRGQARFGLDGNRTGFQQAQLVVDAPIGDQSSLRGGFEIDQTADLRTATLGYVRQFKHFAVRGEGSLDNRGTVALGLTLAFSMGPDPVDGGWRVSRERLAEQGQATVEVFRDDNGDGLRQAGEPGVEGVAVEAGFRHAEEPTNGSGRAVIDGLVPYVPVLVSIDEGKLEDPLLRPKGRGMVVVPRPGVAAKVLLPLAPTGEVEAYLLGPDGEAVGGAMIELTDPAGNVLFRTISDFDGYVLFDTVPYGQYRLRLADKSAAKLGLASRIGTDLLIDKAGPSQRLGRIRLLSVPASGTPSPPIARNP